MHVSPFTEADLAQLRQRGISEEEAHRQLALLEAGPRYADLVRPCIPGDGIELIRDDAADELIELYEESRKASRWLKFVPASGAATRMFKDLLAFSGEDRRDWSWSQVRKSAQQDDGAAGAVVRLCDELDRFAFREEITADQGSEPAELLDALLSERGLGYAQLPKGLLKFHSYPDRCRTAFEEHLVEAVEYVRDAHNTCRLHFTVSPEHLDRFREFLRSARSYYEKRHHVELEVGFSVQKPSTDTLAVDPDDRPFRDADGRLLFRPGGHGALIENLNDLDDDFVFVKNIDNVQPDHLKPSVFRFKRVLAGYLVKLQSRIFELQESLNRPGVPESELDRAMSFVRRRLHVEFPPSGEPHDPKTQREFLVDRLSRPLRVCGVVRNTGEPGGGPFWVRGADGIVSLQIVETAQIDPGSREQQAHLGSSTHFNPVDLVCALRDREGRRFDLRRYVDPEAVIVARKSAEGRELKAFERPGLWNGAMARWNTAFVEVPLETFSPVKTIFDLLRDEHQPA